MKLLWREGTAEIIKEDLANVLPQEQNKIIKMCGTISHQSWKSSKKTPKEFVQLLWRIGHYSVLEHSWFTFFIPFLMQKEQELRLNLLDANHLFCISERDNGIVVSGNARMFIEDYFRYPNPITATLLYFLHQRNPVLFLQTVQEDLVLPPLFTFNPPLKNRQEILVHKAMVVIFHHVSRGFSHEDVRSRNGHNRIASYTQRSTRYVNPLKKDSFNFILPYRKNLPIGIFLNLSLKNPPEIFPKNIALTNKETIALFSGIYKGLINKGLKPEEARQWLPIGIETEIAQTMNYLEWYHWFIIRTQRAAHPEIRFVACNLLHQVQKDIPDIFKGFQFFKDDEDIEYTKFSSPDEKNVLLV